MGEEARGQAIKEFKEGFGDAKERQYKGCIKAIAERLYKNGYRFGRGGEEGGDVMPPNVIYRKGKDRYRAKIWNPTTKKSVVGPSRMTLKEACRDLPSIKAQEGGREGSADGAAGAASSA